MSWLSATGGWLALKTTDQNRRLLSEMTRFAILVPSGCLQFAAIHIRFICRMQIRSKDVSGKAGRLRAEPGVSSSHAREASKVRELTSVCMEAFSTSRLYALQWRAQ